MFKTAAAVSVLLTGMLMATMVTMINAAPVNDSVTSLPGYVGPLPSAHYSGFAPNGMGAFLHYYWVFPEEADPATAPVVFWTNGGPGCSSMEGWAYELGPFKFYYWNSSEAEGITGYENNTVPFARNPHTWAKFAHLVFVENPPGVGFSYRLDDNFTITDSMNALSNYNALVWLFQNAFPEFVNNGLYLSGESYAGIYVPTLAAEILQESAAVGSSRPLVLLPGFRGIIVGNGVTDVTWDFNFATSVGLFAAQQGILMMSDFQAAAAVCLDSPDSEACYQVQDMFYSDTIRMNPYFVSGMCFDPATLPPYRQTGSKKRLRRAYRNKNRISRQALQMSELSTVHFPHPSSVVDQLRSADEAVGVPRNAVGDNSTSCGDEVYMDRYLSRPDVRAALHVPGNFIGLSRLCYDIPYEYDIDNVVEIYNQLMALNKTVVIYNGNADSVVPFTGTFQWIAHTTDWVQHTSNAQWTFTDPMDRPEYGPQVGGQAIQLRRPVTTGGGDNSGSTWLILVNGAGHMVPEDKPAAAFEFIRRIVTGVFFPEATVLTTHVAFQAPNVAALANLVVTPNATTATPAPLGTGNAVETFWADHKDAIVSSCATFVGTVILVCLIVHCINRRKRNRRHASVDQHLFMQP